MKKMTAVAILTTMMLSASALADEGGFTGPGSTNTTTSTQGGFSAPSSSITTVVNTRTLGDDAWVTLKGNIEQRTGDNSYEFLDKTGSIALKIDRKRWNGLTISPGDVVIIQGKVDKGLNDLKVDVKQITKNS